jgi:hypothetical protein
MHTITSVAEKPQLHPLLNLRVWPRPLPTGENEFSVWMNIIASVQEKL